MTRELRILFLLLFWLQLLDGILTYVGMDYCYYKEGNPLVLKAIEYYGLGLGLILAKAISCIIIILVYNVCKSMERVSKVILMTSYVALCCYLYVISVWIYLIIECINYEYI